MSRWGIMKKYTVLFFLATKENWVGDEDGKRGKVARKCLYIYIYIYVMIRG